MRNYTILRNTTNHTNRTLSRRPTYLQPERLPNNQSNARRVVNNSATESPHPPTSEDTTKRNMLTKAKSIYARYVAKGTVETRIGGKNMYAGSKPEETRKTLSTGNLSIQKLDDARLLIYASKLTGGISVERSAHNTYHIP